MAETSFLRYLNPFDFLPMLGTAAQLPPAVAGAPSARPSVAPGENLPPAPLDEGVERGALPASATAALDRIRRGQTAGMGTGIRRSSPVVTPGETAAPAPVEQPAAPQTATSAPQEQPAKDGNDPWERLARFGFAMAASNNPSLFGQLGEAGLAMMRGNREARQDARQSRELDVMQEYRRSQIEVARAEAEWQRDPNNPRNVALLAEARYREAAAAAALRRGEGGGGGGASDGQGIPMMGEDGRMTIFYPRSSRSVQAPEGLSMVGSNANTPEERRYAAWAERRQRALSELVGPNSMFGGNQAEVERRMRIWDSMSPEPARRRPGAPAAQTEAPAQQETNRVRIPYNSPR